MANLRNDAGVSELYDSERKAVRNIAYAMRIKHSFRGVKTVDQEDAIKRAFTLEAVNRCAEIGLIAQVEWAWQDTDQKTGNVTAQSPDVSENPDDNNLYWNPRIQIIGRTDKISEYDHDQQKFEIRKGVLDGVEGVINPNTGLLGEEKRKNIY